MIFSCETNGPATQNSTGIKLHKIIRQKYLGSCIPERNGSSFRLHTQNTDTPEVLSNVHYSFRTRFGPRVKQTGGDPRIPEHLHKYAAGVSN